MRITRAGIDQLTDVLFVLNSTADELHRRGVDQWRYGFTAERIRPYVARAEMWLVFDGRVPVATVRADSEADPDFWTPAEAAQSALYVSKLARTVRAPRGTGDLLLRWVTDRAAVLGYDLVRLDVWRTNLALQRFYLDRGWAHLRTVEAPGRMSGALFERRALPDPAARQAFTEPAPVTVCPPPLVDPDTGRFGSVLW